MDDLSAATEEDVKSFFRLYYAPNNAFLAIVGDFDPAQAKAWVQKYFGDIPRGKPITRPAVAPVTLDAERRLVYEDRVQLPRLYVQWPTVGEKHDDRFALDVLGAILSGPRTARLTKALVYDKQSAASVSAFQSTNEDVGDFGMTITPRPGNTLTDLEQAADAVIEKLKAEGPTAEEIQKATAGEELGFVRGLESNLGKAMRLSDGAGFHGDAGLLPHRVQQGPGGDGRRRQARRQQVPDQGARRAEHRARWASSIRPRSLARARRSPMMPRRHQARRHGDECTTSVTRRTIVSAAAVAMVVALSLGASARQALDRTKTTGAGQDARPARADLDEERAGQRRRPDRVGEARPAARRRSASRSSAARISSSRRSATGLASITAAMMSEGTKTQDGEALSNALQLLGTSVSTTDRRRKRRR